MVKSRKAYEFLRSRIIDGTYRPGDRIVIDRVASKLHLSIIPIREAIRHLEADGLVQNIPYSGPIVQLLNESDYEETQWVLALLDGGAAFLAAKSLTKRNITKLERLNEAMERALDDLDFEQVSELNKKFHYTIYEKCGNEFLVDRLKLCWQRLAQIRKSIFSFVPRRTRESIKEHKELIHLFKTAASPEKIEEFARQHKLKMLTALQHREKAMATKQPL
jgi:DNA-binding GntR family transcriptional regulator